MYNRFLISVSAFILLSGHLSVSGQSLCDLTITGAVIDISTFGPLKNANILVEETGQGSFTDATGLFVIQNLCPGDYHLSISHIGCASVRKFVQLTTDTIFQIELDHHSHHLDKVIITESRNAAGTQKSNVLQNNKIAENSNLNLGNLLENISGVNVLRTGYGIAKPVIHGLYGNRLLILNNGITLSGQQWGNDHSPEIDPLASNRIMVIKGTGVIQYQGSSLGSIIVLEPLKIEKDPHLHGKMSYFFDSNGKGHNINTRLQKSYNSLGWSLNTTLRKSGDRSSAEYFLRNTGNEEASLAFRIEKKHSEKWSSELYFSSFNTKIGILRGSHIGNLTDLEEALTRRVPFFTQAHFTYNIDAPYQTVGHHFIKLQSKYFLNDHQWLDFSYGGQLNIRKEYDIRRGSRSDRPSLSMTQFTHFIESKYSAQINHVWEFKTGVQFNLTDNTNNAETGILPLIPDYLSIENGAFSMITGKLSKFTVEAGLRYDFVYQNVAQISGTLPRTVNRYFNNFHNLNASTGLSTKLSEAFTVSANVGLNTRNPGINERYSNGLHQGVSGIEEGNISLQTEKAVKTTISLEGSLNNRLFFDIMGYYQHISDYIFLNPQDKFRLTIRGAFPVFSYEQTDAVIYGFDLGSTTVISDHFNFSAKYSYIRGKDISQHIPLIFIPPPNLTSGINFHLDKLSIINNFEADLSYRIVFQQSNLLPDQDFVVAPPAYSLLSAKIAGSLRVKNGSLNIYLKSDNLLNKAYRDYMNRQRYFADELGRNFTFGVSYQF